MRRTGEPVLRVLHVFGRMDRGGAELRTVELAESFGGERVRSDFAVLTGLDGALDDRVRAAGGDVVKCPLGARFPAAFYRLVRRGRYDVVHSHVHFFSGVILAIARLAGTPKRIAHFRTAIVNDKRDGPGRRVQLALCRRLVDLAATDILAVGEGAMHGAWRADWQSDPRCRVVYNGLAPDRVRLAPRRAHASSPPTIVNVASVQPLKNQLRLVGIMRRCARELPGVRLLLIGREVGDYGGKVRRAVADAGLSQCVELLGEVADPAPLVAGANLMVAPSLWEGLSGAVLEACALGVPVLASDLPGNRELARHFPHVTVMDLDEDDEAWAAAIVRIAGSDQRCDLDPAACLANSPFDLARSREAHYEIWSRARAFV
jgi:glycosyltransferase involved in cell wall biosynthesis